VKIFRNLTVRVLVAIALGVVLGVVAPDTAKAMRPLGDIFINLVKMVIGPIIFLTIVLGIANMADLKKVGKVGAKAILYFEIVTTFALAIGLIVVNVTKPGAGINVSALAKGDVSKYAEQGKALTLVDFVTHIVPTSVVKAFSDGDILQIVFFAVLFGIALTALGAHASPLTDVLDKLLHVFFRIVHIIMIVAPIGAFGAMAYTIGNFGLHALLPLGRLMLDVYITMFIFVFVVLNVVARLFRFSLWEYLKYIREEIVLVLGTSSSEVALPRMIDKMERYARPRPSSGW
jgi:aerobic C4-dicarboxylate transport protein